MQWVQKIVTWIMSCQTKLGFVCFFPTDSYDWRDKCMRGLSQPIASGVKLFFLEKQWKGVYWDEICGNRTDVLMTVVPLTHIRTCAQRAEQHSLESGGASQWARNHGPLCSRLFQSLQELSWLSHSSSLPGASWTLFLQNVRTVCFFLSKPYLIFTELSSLMFCPDAHNHHSAHD